MSGMYTDVSMKGLAVLAAVDAGILPKVNGGWDDTSFNKFWELFEKSLLEKGFDPFADYIKVLEKKRNRSANWDECQIPQSTNRVVLLALGVIVAQFLDMLFKLG